MRDEPCANNDVVATDVPPAFGARYWHPKRAPDGPVYRIKRAIASAVNIGPPRAGTTFTRPVNAAARSAPPLDRQHTRHADTP